MFIMSNYVNVLKIIKFPTDLLKTWKDKYLAYSFLNYMKRGSCQYNI